MSVDDPQTDDSKLASLLDLALADDARKDDAGPMSTTLLELSRSVGTLVDEGLLSPRVWNGLCSKADMKLLTMGDVLMMPLPWPDVLAAMKIRWKVMRLQEGSNDRGVAATVLYYLTVLVARLRCRTRITSLTDAELRQGLAWLSNQSWLEEPLLLLVQDLQRVDPWPELDTPI